MALTLSYTPQTTLDAVNQMLLSIGKAPVNTLNFAGINDVNFAQTVLHNVNREVQTKGWWFNREAAFPMNPDVSGNLLPAANVLDIKPSLRDDRYILRYNSASGVNAMALYDLENHTFNIGQYLNGQPLKCNVVWFFQFEQIPQAARAYISRRAGREFQTSAVGSQTLYQFTKEMELEAMTEMQRQEARDGQSNMFATPTRNSRIFNRQPGAYRRSW